MTTNIEARKMGRPQTGCSAHAVDAVAQAADRPGADAQRALADRLDECVALARQHDVARRVHALVQLVRRAVGRHLQLGAGDLLHDLRIVLQQLDRDPAVGSLRCPRSPRRRPAAPARRSCARPRGPGPGARAGGHCGRDRRRGSPRSTASMPSPFEPMAGTTGTPSRRERARASISMPWEMATSLMFRTTTSGRSSSSSSVVR